MDIYKIIRSAIIILFSLLITGVSETTSALSGICPEYPGGLQVFVPEPDGENYPEGDVWRWRLALIPENIETYYGLKVYGVGGEQPIKVNYHVEYIGGLGLTEDSQADLPVRFSVLLNEQFIPLGEDGSLYKDETMPYRKRFVLPLELGSLSEGLHDLIVIMIPNPGKQPYFPDGPFHGFIEAARTTLIVGNPEAMKEDTHDYHRLTTASTEKGMGRSVLLSLDELGNPWSGTNFEPSLTLSPNAEYRFNIFLSEEYYFADYSYTPEVQMRPDPLNFALIMLENGVPMPIIDNASVFYGQFPSEATLVKLPVTRTAPETERREILVIRIDFPQRPLCQLIAGTHDGVFVDRAAIDIEP